MICLKIRKLHSDAMQAENLLISSTSNPRIKALHKLEDSRYRRSSGLFVVEGRREVSFAISAGYHATGFYYCRELFPEFHADQAPVFQVTPQVYEKIAYRGGTEGVIGVFKSRSHVLPPAQHVEDGIYIILESVEKPGNLGAILRTADAAAVKGVILIGENTDVYNPNTIRSSVGAFFTVPLFVTKRDELIQWLKDSGLELLVLSPDGARSLYLQKVASRVALLFGTEASGVSEEWKNDESAVCVSLPMRGRLDSLNVSNTVAVAVFEVLRQQGKV